MVPFYKTLLGPILLTQARYVRKSTPRLPEAEGERDGSVGAGPDTLRLLVVGDSSAAGVGVSRQDEALAVPLARRIAELTGRRVQWQLVARSGVVTHEALDLVREAALRPADILVTSLGTNDVTAQHSPSRYVTAYAALVDELRRRTGFRWFIANGLPPMHMMPAAPQPLRWYLGRCACRLDTALRRWLEHLPEADYCSLQWAQAQDMASDRFHPGPRQYAQWSAELARKIAAKVDATENAAA
ncbi:SGNH/GDSL hydrolase family protein [Tahibacter amnicola]|uniref:SGNH/GDSL hydrolase family protein n=1 Tax=Tahibacter amnicola TaxID=2976241 RepID=A0ABY6BEF4_9GAMM|nr:SGNH/GDSL hydrolase family protein [Tahibacter amnicola]UXI67927.1 SGNH/GDSL hydrolase family protein [Tahibacter amnicola]